MLTERKCCKCDKVKSIKQFYENKSESTGYDFQCKDCSNELNYSYGLVRRYDITLVQYNQKLSEQQFKCAICKEPVDTSQRLSVDHNHSLNKGDKGFIRGLLCNGCNLGIGAFDENIDHLKAAIEYLEKYNLGKSAQQLEAIDYQI